MPFLATPTNHTTRAFFGGLEAEPSESEDDAESSGDEQSSIDCSQLIDPSVHTSTAASRTVGGHASSDNNNAAVLPPLIEEGNTYGVEAATARSDSNSIPPPPLGHPLSNNEHSTSKNSVSRPTIQTTGSSLPTPITTPQMEQQQSPAPGFLSSVPSATTMHVSNVDAVAYQRMEEESERNVAWAIHVVLGGFCALVIVSSVMTFFIVEKYGLVVLVGSMVVVCFMIFLMWFVDQTVLSQNPRLKPVRQKIIRVVQLAKKAVVEEFQLFKRDWNEHFLLTNGGASSMDDDEEDNDNNNNDDDEEQRSTRGAVPVGRRGGGTTQPARKKRSVVFRAIKSSFQMGRRVWGGRNKKATNHNNKGQQEPKYHPPNADNGVIA